MKKSTKSSRRRLPRRKRSQRRPMKPVQGLLSMREQIRDALVSQIRDAVATTARQLVQDEVHELVGAPWSRKGNSPLRRGGGTRTTILVGGEPHVIERTRVRDQELGKEHSLRTVEALQSRDAFDDEVKSLLVRGVSTRNYDGALTAIADGLGLQKSAVSSAFQRASQKDLDAINGRELGESKFVTIFIDGVGFADHLCVVALGVTEDGQKRVLGLREGATENAQVVNDLLADIVERGLQTPPRVLFVLDGAKALHKAVRSTFGYRALIQRCTLHKQRNVLSYLPTTWHREAARRLRMAWSLASHTDARSELKKVVRWLSKISESAAASLEEGLEETITVHRLGIGGTLRRTLLTTNPIESAFDLVRTHSRRVKRWRGSSMVMRWAGFGLVRAEQQFRRVKGFAAIPALVTALENESLKESNISA